MSSSQFTDRSLIWTATKIVACVIVIAAIAVLLSVVDTGESQADIAWLNPFERSQADRFDDALEQLGHDDVERYDLDGNTVYFSQTTTRKAPREAMVAYQEEFQRQGLNDRIYSGIVADEQHRRTETALTGGLVPMALTDHHVTLGGMVTANEAEDGDDLIENYDRADHIHDLFDAHRYIEISRAPDRRYTTVTATWSDEFFDYRRMDPLSGSDDGYDDIVPACPGCIRVSRFADQNPDRVDRTKLSFIGPRSVEQTRHYYAKALAERGWERQPLDASLDRIAAVTGQSFPRGKTDRYRRDDRQLTMTVTTDEVTGHSLTMVSYSGL